MISKGSKAVNGILRATDKLRKTIGHKGDKLVKAKLKANYKTYQPPAFVLDKVESLVDLGIPVYKLGQGDKWVFYLHGGTYVDQPLRFHWMFVERLSEDGVMAILPIYNKAPTYTCDVVVPQVADVFVKLVERYGNDVTVIGDSAGGGLALAMTQLLQSQGNALPTRLVLFSPWLDINTNNPDIIDNMCRDVMLDIQALRTLGKQYLGNNETNCPLASPLFGGNVNCPIYIFVGSDEIMLADCVKYKRLYNSQGNITLREFPKMQHCFCLVPTKEADEVYYEVTGLIKG